MTKVFVIFIIFLSFLSCKQKAQTPEIKSKKTEFNTFQKFPKAEKLNSISAEKVSEWEEYKNIATFLERFSSISSNEILINAIETKDLVDSLKTNKKPIFLDKPSLNSRINVLQNEVLRLADMTKIPSITHEEVTIQTLKTIDVFSSLNEKINTLYSQKSFEDEISNKNEVLKDSTIKNEKTFKKNKKSLSIKKDKSLLQKNIK